MNKAVSSLFLGLLFICIFVSWFRIQPNVSAQGETFVSVVNAVDGTFDFNFTSATPIGTVFTANVTVTDVTFLAGWQLNLTYDATLLNVIGYDQLVMPSDNVFGEYAYFFTPKLRAGMVFWSTAISISAPFDYVNVTGTRTLCQINFTVIKNDESVWTPLHLVVIGEDPFSYTYIVDYDTVEEIPFTPRDGYYYGGLKVVSCLGDINLDFLTDGKDFVLVKKAMGSTPGSPRWNPKADLNADSSVGVQDYQIVKTHIPSVFP